VKLLEHSFSADRYRAERSAQRYARHVHSIVSGRKFSRAPVSTILDWLCEVEPHRLAASIATGLRWSPLTELYRTAYQEVKRVPGAPRGAPGATTVGKSDRRAAPAPLTPAALKRARTRGPASAVFEFELPTWMVNGLPRPLQEPGGFGRMLNPRAWAAWTDHPELIAGCSLPGAGGGAELVVATLVRLQESDDPDAYFLTAWAPTEHLARRPKVLARGKIRCHSLPWWEQRVLQLCCGTRAQLYAAWQTRDGVSLAIAEGGRWTEVRAIKHAGSVGWSLMPAPDPILLWFDPREEGNSIPHQALATRPVGRRRHEARSDQCAPWLPETPLGALMRLRRVSIQ
jgi:hypothetical protein